MTDASELTCFVQSIGAAPVAPAPRMETPADQLPEVFAGRYQIDRLLGVGGMGAVYRCRDLLREQFGDPAPWIALKTLSSDFLEYPDASALLYSEFALTARLHHGNVVRVFDFGLDQHSQRPFITLELLHGLTLNQLLVERPRGLPWHEWQEIAVATLEALSHSHKQGVLHGDIKPSNIMVGNAGLRLFDYGLGQADDGLLPGLPRLSRDRIAAWTPRYAALELLEGSPLTASSDLYALACVLLELATGQHPFQRKSAQEAHNERLDRHLQRPAQIPAPVWAALRTALAFDPQHRSITSAEWLATLKKPVRFQRLRQWVNAK